MQVNELAVLTFAAAPASGGAGSYLDWGAVHISVANLLIIILMVVTFVAALLLPFPHDSESPPAAPPGPPEEAEGRP